MVSKIKAIQAAEISEILNSPELSRFVLIVYRELFDSTNKRFCATAITEFSKIIKLNGIKKLNEMSKPKKYKLKDGCSIYISESRKTYTAENITDKIAADLLKKYPHLKDKFDISK